MGNSAWRGGLSNIGLAGEGFEGRSTPPGELEAAETLLQSWSLAR